MFEWLSNMWTSSWVTKDAWQHVPQELVAAAPPKPSDYRDALPPTFQKTGELYAPYIAKEGKWTLGLFDMW